MARSVLRELKCDEHMWYEGGRITKITVITIYTFGVTYDSGYGGAVR